MNALDERYAVVWLPENRFLARWLRPSEAAAFVETYNRVMRGAAGHAEMVRQTLERRAVREEEGAVN
jgi:hypothetical protein